MSSEERRPANNQEIRRIAGVFFGLIAVIFCLTLFLTKCTPPYYATRFNTMLDANHNLEALSAASDILKQDRYATAAYAYRAVAHARLGNWTAAQSDIGRSVYARFSLPRRRGSRRELPGMAHTCIDQVEQLILPRRFKTELKRGCTTHDG
jgi:hypothetical protein